MQWNNLVRYELVGRGEEDERKMPRIDNIDLIY